MLVGHGHVGPCLGAEAGVSDRGHGVGLPEFVVGGDGGGVGTPLATDHGHEMLVDIVRFQELHETVGGGGERDHMVVIVQVARLGGSEGREGAALAQAASAPEPLPVPLRERGAIS